MSSSQGITSLLREHKTLLIAILVGLFLLELEIFAVAVTRSGKKSLLQVYDHQGQIVYETDGRYLDAFNQESFEKTFGPLENYQVRRVTRTVPFPFRAWFVAAVGLPVGGMLLFAFVIRAFVAVFYGDRHRPGETGEGEKQPPETQIERVMSKIGTLNIFTIGFFLFLMIIGYWIIPNVILYVGKIGFDAIHRYKWFFLGGLGILLGIFVWIVYLRYLLAKKHIESQNELDKFRLQLEFDQARQGPLQIESPEPTAGERRRLPTDAGPDGDLENRMKKKDLNTLESKGIAHGSHGESSHISCR